MKTLLPCVVLIFILIFYPGVALSAECDILWLHPDQAPLIIIKKGYGKGMGTIDRMEAWFAGHLKDCKHTDESANYERILRLIRKKENACCIPLYKTPERKKFVEFSVPYQIVLSNALIIADSSRKQLEPFIGPDGKVSL